MKRIGQRLRILILFAATSLVAPPVAFPADSPAPSSSAVPTAAASPAPGDGFQAVAAADEFGSIESAATPDKHDHAEFRGEAKAFKWVLGILFATLVAGLLVRFSATRNLRAVFLTCSVAVLGFYKGACPCPIQSLQYSVLNLLGHDYKWQTLVYLLGLLPLTYLFGRVFCGWICHMGALQEFLFLGNRLRYLQSERAQTMMRAVRALALFALIVQLAVTRTNLYKKIDPFAVLFNFNSLYAAGWVLVGVLIVASVLIHRPFCKTLCPIGLILGWIAKLPGASVLGPNLQCVGCSVCNSACRINAITRDGKRSILENQECIRCGECLEGCKKSSLTFHRRGGRHPARVELQCPPSPLTAAASTTHAAGPPTAATPRPASNLTPLSR
jgi:NosR/NirI family nitrous oxide reductase transcriptional regulator